MGDWERNFGSYGMQNGGMGVIDGITGDDDSSTHIPKRGPSTQVFKTWSEASQFAQKHREWRVVRGEGEHQFLVKRDQGNAQQAQDRLEDKMLEGILLTISKWPSGLRESSGSCFYRKRYFEAWFQPYEEFALSTDPGSYSLRYRAKYLCMRITNVMPGVKFTELVPVEVCSQPEDTLRDWIDALLDSFDAPPA